MNTPAKPGREPKPFRCSLCRKACDRRFSLGRFGGGSYKRAARHGRIQVCEACVLDLAQSTGPNSRGFDVRSVQSLAARLLGVTTYQSLPSRRRSGLAVGNTLNTMLSRFRTTWRSTPEAERIDLIGAWLSGDADTVNRPYMSEYEIAHVERVLTKLRAALVAA